MGLVVRSVASQVKIAPSDTAAFDAFGRIRMSEPETIFDSKLIVDNAPLFWDDTQVSGTAASAHNTNQASVTLSVSSAIGRRVRQTKRRFAYQPGKSQLIFMTFVMGTATANVTKQVGLFDDRNGLFLRQTGSGVSFVRRTYTSGTAVDNAVAQADWNLDKMNGSGVSGITLDFTKSQILIMDFEWLGVGRVRFGFVVDGVVYYAHEMLHANVLSLVYMSTPNLPLRYEIESTASATASLVCICSSVISEGGVTASGFDLSVDRGTTPLQTANDANIYPLLALRLQSAYFGATVNLTKLSIVCTTSSPFRWCLLLNPTITGTALSYSAVTNSAIEADVARTNATTLSGGTQVASGYAAQSGDSSLILDTPALLALGSTYAGVADQLVLGVSRLSTQAETFYASLSWREVI